MKYEVIRKEYEEVTGISFVDSTPIEVCHPCRSRSHKVFQDIAGWGKNSMGWPDRL